MFCVSKTNIEKLKQSNFGKTLFLIGTENSFVEKQQQQIDLLTKTAEQRYKELTLKKPTQIVQRIAQKHIAILLRNYNSKFKPDTKEIGLVPVFILG